MRVTQMVRAFLEAVELANKVKSGSNLLMRNSIKTFMGGEARLPPAGAAHPSVPAAIKVLGCRNGLICNS